MSHLHAVNQAFKTLSKLIGRDRIIVIGTYKTYLKFLEQAAESGFPPFHGRYDAETSKGKWKEQLAEYKQEFCDIIEHCDYDGEHVNPSTIIDVISGRQPHFPTLAQGRVVPFAPHAFPQCFSVTFCADTEHRDSFEFLFSSEQEAKVTCDV